MINLTDTAKKEIKKLLTESEFSSVRINIKSGGCSGFSYELSFDNKNDKDEIINFDNEVSVIINKKILPIINNLEINFSSGLQGKGFEFNNPDATKTCSCGISFNYRK